MKLRHHIKTHHHITIWVACTLILILTVVTTSTPTQTAAQDPSGLSKQIIDDGNEEIVKWEQVVECVQDSKKISDLVSKEKSLYADSSKVINELDSLRVKYEPTRTDSEKARISVLESEHAKINSDLAATQSELSKVSNKSGPSAECKTAFVKSAVKNMTKWAEKTSTFLAKLETTSQLIAKIEKALPELKKASSNETLINNIEDDIKTINASINILQPFFNDMKKEMDEFIGLINTNPVAAYDKMSKIGRDDIKFKKAETAAESMVSALSRLEKSLETLANSTATPTPTPSPVPTN